MSDEFQDISSRLPDIGIALAQRIAARNANVEGALPPPVTVDPYKLMMGRKNGETNEIDPTTIQKWPDADVKRLQDYCTKVGVIGFNPGRMPPMVALAMLKQQFGEFADVPLEERVPDGYEKRGTPSGYGPNYPYSQAMNKKQVLHG